MEDIISIFTNKNNYSINYPMICFEIFNQSINAPSGNLKIPNKNRINKSLGSHGVSVVDIDLERRRFKFQNWWGDEWGIQGFGYVPFNYLKKFLTEAWIQFYKYNSTIQLIEKYKENKLLFKLLKCKSKVENRADLWVLDVFKRKKIVGWSHFRYYDKIIQVEELFILPKFRNKKIGSEILSKIEQQFLQNSPKKIICFVHVEDLINTSRLQIVKRFFEKNHFKIENNTSEFKGCYWKVYKNL